MKSLNKVMLIGNLGSNPEAKAIPSGQTLVTFSIATNESYKNQNGETVEKTEWHRITVWGKLGDICKQYLTKGSPVYIEGKIQTRSWDDEKSGQKRYSTEIVASDLVMLGSKGSSNSSSSGSDYSSKETSSTSVPSPDDDNLPF